jgi:hypothetical protein
MKKAIFTLLIGLLLPLSLGQTAQCAQTKRPNAASCAAAVFFGAATGAIIRYISAQRQLTKCYKLQDEALYLNVLEGNLNNTPVNTKALNTLNAKLQKNGPQRDWWHISASEYTQQKARFKEIDTTIKKINLHTQDNHICRDNSEACINNIIAVSNLKEHVDQAQRAHEKIQEKYYYHEIRNRRNRYFKASLCLTAFGSILAWISMQK